MSKFNNKGLTLVELLAVIVITSIIIILLTSLFVSGLTKTKEIQAESQLRDDADYIMSNFVKALYNTKQEQIVRNVTNADGSYLEVSNDLSKCPKKEDGSFNITTECEGTLKKLGFVKSGNEIIVQLLDESISTNYSKLIYVTPIVPGANEPTSIIEGNPRDTSIYNVIIRLETTYPRFNKDVTKVISFKNSLQPIVK